MTHWTEHESLKTACQEAKDWARQFPTFQDFWDACGNSSWMLWAVDHGVITNIPPGFVAACDEAGRVFCTAIRAALPNPVPVWEKGEGGTAMIPVADWKWFGCAGHLGVAEDCRFHLCTQVGDYLISTVGEYLPDETVREILAESRGVVLEGRGDARRADYMRKIGYEDIGFDRKYETMVFRIAEGVCDSAECGCGFPRITGWSALESDGYNRAGDATKGHMVMCLKWAGKENDDAAHS